MLNNFLCEKSGQSNHVSPVPLFFMSQALPTKRDKRLWGRECNYSRYEKRGLHDIVFPTTHITNLNLLRKNMSYRL